jgi:hypothetical protein
MSISKRNVITPRRKTPKSSLRGKGDYSQEIMDLPKPLPRLEAKIDHLEKMLTKSHANANANSSLGSSVGRALGTLVGQGDLGGMAGKAAGTLMSKYFGHGDYTLKSNSLFPGRNSSSAAGPVVPKFSNQGKRGTRIIERECLGDLISSATPGQFNNTPYPINPTNSATFPWLSKLAVNYDQWEPNGIVFEFVSTSSEFNGASQALGTVIMATDYDTYDVTYPNKIQMENADYACSTRPSNCLEHGIECDKNERLSPLLYTASPGSGLPLTQTTLGNFQVATTGCSVASVNLGEIWVSYDITFYKKQLLPVPFPVAGVPRFYASGTTTATTGQYSNAVISDSFEITLAPAVGVGSHITFFTSNIALGSARMYLITYFRITPGADDPTLSPINCTVVNERHSNATSSSNNTYLVLVAAGATFAGYLTSTTAISSAFALSIDEVPLTAAI